MQYSMKKSKKLLILFSCIFLLCFLTMPQEIHAANYVTKRIREVKKEYPQGSKMNKWVLLLLWWIKGEMFITLRLIMGDVMRWLLM